MTKRNAGIIAYGTEEDRQRLAVLSVLSHNKSGSELIIDMIRTKYTEVMGEIPPSETGLLK